MKIPIEIKSKDSILNGKLLMENINITNLNKLLKPENEHLLKHYENIGRDDIYENEFVKTLYCTEKNQLKNYANNIKFGRAFVKYDKVRKLNNYGRVFPSRSLGLFSFRKQIRGALAFGQYVDIDIVNCHPILLLQICKSNNIECKYLEKYVNKRDKYLNLIIDHYNVDKAKAKELFIILLYFGSFKRWAEDNKIEKEIIEPIEKLRIELKNIGTELSNNNKDLAKLIENKILMSKNKKKNKNIIGTTISFILQEWECQILEQLYIYCTDKKIINNDCVLCADGLMININHYNENLLLEFNEIIKDKLGFDLTFIKKELNTEILDKLI